MGSRGFPHIADIGLVVAVFVLGSWLGNREQMVAILTLRSVMTLSEVSSLQLSLITIITWLKLRIFAANTNIFVIRADP